MYFLWLKNFVEKGLSACVMDQFGKTRIIEEILTCSVTNSVFLHVQIILDQFNMLSAAGATFY